MTPDELRALADALCVRHYDLATVDVIRAADYLRACADEKSVGVYVHRPAELRYGVEWLVGDPMPDGTQLFTHPAPAAPQAEPCVGNDPTCPCQDGDTCHYRDTDRTKAWPIPDAEPSNNCRGVPRRGCNYLSQCGSVCNKCGHIHNPVADAVTAQVEPIDPHMIAAEDRFPDDDGPVILGEPDTLTPDDVRRVTRRAEPKRPIIEVNVFPQHEYWRVELAVGTETFVFDEVRVSQTNAEAYANRLRVALGITGDSDAD